MAWMSKNWTMTGIIMGLVVTLKHVLHIGDRPTVTVQYPYERMKLAPRFRGRHAVDEDACIGCGICEVNCPNSTIRIVKYKGRWFPELNLGMCMFCGLCVDACPMNAIKMTQDYELADYTRESVVYGPDRLLFKRGEKW
ncbi:NADH-quinone oxidoreductase, chain I [Candidatus Methanoperedens nitroreducens]|uniref:NADH-quinone oxidoreductase, chain I n=1 Tax=Candidatus Methanoperedens nitratireducens TaxID=1392998 RepID=A0A062VB50_9EURY|nr:NADH-quinone oxidoreductase subunit I [Candidatus Methanoperedens nitroreducens]KCZ72540.1 NADH-quinone oxidoreductase, chain I [Candidatus Methanoperedens nitroreducens]MDJ1423526.1 NADH-quinone oxidoreductase subunit I [Candidatus Methanoperedens sp.]